MKHERRHRAGLISNLVRVSSDEKQPVTSYTVESLRWKARFVTPITICHRVHSGCDVTDHGSHFDYAEAGSSSIKFIVQFPRYTLSIYRSLHRIHGALNIERTSIDSLDNGRKQCKNRFTNWVTRKERNKKKDCFFISFTTPVSFPVWLRFLRVPEHSTGINLCLLYIWQINGNKIKQGNKRFVMEKDNRIPGWLKAKRNK